MTEFAASNYVNVLTGMTPFFVNHSFHPYTGIEPPRMYKEEQKAEQLAANNIVVQ